MSYDAEHATAYRLAQVDGWKCADRHIIARKAARRKAKDPRRLWSFIEPTPAEIEEARRIEAILSAS